MNDTRARAVRDLNDFSHGRGIEVGPLFAPTFDRAEVDVRYLDVVTTEELRSYYAADPRVDENAIVPVDYALTHDGVVRSIAETVGDDAPFDWAFASHVVEHVPDLIGWLADVASVVGPGAALVLVVPDKRYTFDLHRAPTTVGAMIQAHRAGDTIPSIRAVYDHFHEALTVESTDLWAARAATHPPRIYSEDEADSYVALHGISHVDPHVWIFTPELFLLQMNELRRRGLSSWYVDGFESTPPDQLEFYVRLRRMGEVTTGPLDDEVLPVDDRPHWMIENADLRAELHQVRTRLRRQRRRTQRLRRRLSAMESSRRWRLASSLAAPARLLRRR